MGTGLVFSGIRYGKPLSDTTLSKPLRELGIPAVPHGFQSSFRDWAAERTDAPRGLAGLLNPFKVRPGTIRTDAEGTSKGYILRCRLNTTGSKTSRSRFSESGQPLLLPGCESAPAGIR